MLEVSRNICQKCLAGIAIGGLLVMVGCSGDNSLISAPNSVVYERVTGTNIEAPVTECSALEESQLTVLNKLQYVNMIRDVYHPLTIDISEEVESIYFPDYFDQVFLQRLSSVSDLVAEEVITNFDQLELACDFDVACAESFISKFGRRAFRRLLTEEEVSELLEKFSEQPTFDDGIKQIVRIFAIDSNAIYQYVEGIAAEGGKVLLNDFEKASRLSFLLWNTIPDDELLDAAERGSLSTKAGFHKQAERLLNARERVGDSTTAFFRHWFGLDYAIGKMQPNFDTALKEFDLLIKDAYHNESSLNDLFTTNIAFVNRDLADIYGLSTEGRIEGKFERVLLDDRKGLLTRAAFLTGTSDSSRSIPTERGIVVGTHLACQTWPLSEPAELQDSLAFLFYQQEEGETRRDTLTRTTGHSRVCSSCHFLTDNIGFTLENFDGHGRYRELDNKVPINPSVEDSFFGPINNANDLGDIVGNAELVKNCFVREWYQHVFLRKYMKPLTNSYGYATEVNQLGHTVPVPSQDDCELQRLNSRFSELDGDLVGLLRELVDSPAFHYYRL